MLSINLYLIYINHNMYKCIPIINKYYNKPYWKWVYKDIKYIIRSWRLYYKNNRKNKTVLFYPEYPKRMNPLHQIFKSLDFSCWGGKFCRNIRRAFQKSFDNK